jgi:excisionase family DNA binding protein
MTNRRREFIPGAGSRPAPYLAAGVELFTLTRPVHDRLLLADTRQDEEPWLLRPEAVARLLDLSRAKVYQMIADGTLKSVTIGRSRRIRREDLQRYVIDLAVQQR